MTDRTAQPPLVALLTDFGTRDPYVGAMRAVIVSRCPGVTLVDLGHDVPPQQVAIGARHLVATVPLLPPTSITVAVVDPGVGTARKAIALRTDSGHRLVGPDNGLLVPVADELGGIVRVVCIDDSPVRRAVAATTFHGRDLFAPVGAHLARGATLVELGRPMDASRLVALPEPVPQRGPEAITGEVVDVDHFGNLITNIPGEWVSGFVPQTLVARIDTPAGQACISGLRRSYGEVAPGTLLVVIGSTGLVEISESMGSAAARLGVAVGARVSLPRV